MPNIKELLKENRKRVKREKRREWAKEHFFDIVNLIIAIIALIVGIFGLYLP